MTQPQDQKQSASDALFIWEHGGSNPRGIGRALVRAIDAATGEKATSAEKGQYAAARVMLAQLAFLLGCGLGGYECGEVDDDISALRGQICDGP